MLRSFLCSLFSRPAIAFLFLTVLLKGLMCVVAPTVASCAEPEAAPDDLRFFRDKIEPVLKSECSRCHSGPAGRVKGGLRVDSREGLRRGGESGPAVVPRKPDESLLIQAIRHEGGREMPPEEPKLSDQTIRDFIRWIEHGAVDPREGESPAARRLDPEQVRKHWSFQPIRKPALPVVRDANRIETPIDTFLLARLDEQGWSFAPPAERAEWLRRVTFDLIGLPPSPEEIDTFVTNSSPEAFERVVDRLLASPHYGERWAQHWLDVVRYAESEGYEYDRHIPDAWRYRDYVIDALNADKPFDRFVLEQLAGDEVGPDDHECLSASIFHRLGPVRRNAGNPEIALSRNEVLTERTDIVGAAFLGLTVGCARCHDHKLEPITQQDYYQLQAYLAATEEHDISLATADELEAWKKRTQEAKDEIQRLKAKARGLTGSEKTQLTERIELLEDTLPGPLATIPATRNDFEKRTPIHVLKRGAWERKGQLVGPRPPSVLEPQATSLPPDVADPRTQLARWLVSPGNPLTARVLVNRLWQRHFGTGLVRTANDLGINGERPSHPELLDWLAATLLDDGWRWKPLHRRIVLSAAYRQASIARKQDTENGSQQLDAANADPDNRLLWKFPRRRLTAEEIRDAMLAVSGRLNERTHGASVTLPVDAELVALLYKPTQWTVTHDPREQDRRSIYLVAKRNLRLPFLEILDAPALLTSCSRRESSTHAPQALELLNGRLSNDLAEAFARRLTDESGGDRQRLVERAFRLAIGRSPTASERALALDFLRDQPVREFALAMFNLNGFLYVP